jgi:hypothetical protein
MDSVVSKLSEIEHAATAIVAEAKLKKASLEKVMQEKRNSFDADLDAKTNAQIAEIHADLEAKMSSILKSQETKNTNVLSALEQDYEQNHSHYAKAILSHMTEV